ncbi:hypothetical protein FB451DRAFT_1198705 [Mycena latifolia]|nr:hypothetical protein FB451DRAFT_1198705 [Mycena latifolia]
MPPVKRTDTGPSINTRSLPYARAYAELVGYKSDLFSAALSNVQGLMHNLAMFFPEDSVVHWTPDAATTTFGPSVASSCRYFTMGYDLDKYVHVPFAKYVDPAGILMLHLGKRVAHCEDNHVDYVGMKEKSQYLPALKKDPATFRSGDIVEMGFALVAFRQSIHGESEKHVCKPVLRTLALLDTSLTKDAYKSRVEAAVPVDAPATPKIPSTKQRACIEVDSDEEDIVEARQQLAELRMTMADGDAQMTQVADS